MTPTDDTLLVVDDSDAKSYTLTRRPGARGPRPSSGRDLTLLDLGGFLDLLPISGCREEAITAVR